MLKKRFRFSFLVILLLILVLVGCTGGGGGSSTYTVTGKVVDADDNLLGGIEIVVTGGKSTTDTTKEDGTFMLTGLKGTCMIKPTSTEYIFPPGETKISGKKDNLIFKALPEEGIDITAIADIIGIATVGVELTAGAITPAEATVKYQWEKGDTVDGTYLTIVGATTNKYKPIAEDTGKFIRVIATGTGGYTGTITSKATAAVILITSPLTSFDQITLTQTGNVADDTVKYSNATDVIKALPTTIEVTLENGSKVNVPVTWANTDTYDAKVADDYTFTATWGAMPTGANNDNSLAAPTVEVRVEDRAKINNVVATSTIAAPIYGAAIENPTFTVTEGSPAYLGASGHWLKKSGDTWSQVSSGTFTEGIWRFNCQVRIDEKLFDGKNGTTHKLAEPLTVKINGVFWFKDSKPMVTDTYSFDWVSSEEYTVTAPEGTTLTFKKQQSHDISTNWVDRPITLYSVASSVDGGTKPYKFSKTFGPDWITVSEIGEISGTPTTIGSNLDLVVRVTDKEDDFKEITISVADTVCNPEDRIEVNNIVATSTITAPIYDAPIANPTFTVIEGSPAHLGSGGHWLKKNGDNWATVYSGKFTEGTWYFACQIRIDRKIFDGKDGATHRLAAPLKVTVGEEVWLENGAPSVDDTYSFAWVASSEYIVKQP